MLGDAPHPRALLDDPDQALLPLFGADFDLNGLKVSPAEPN
jgi:hypothetical protein